MNVLYVSKKVLAAGAASAMTIGLALPVAAQSVYGTVDAGTQVTVGSGGTNVSGDTSVSGSGSVDGIVDTNLGADVKGVVNAIIGGSASSSNSGSGSTGSGSAGASGNGSTQGSVTVSGQGGVDADLGIIVITRADVDGDAAVSGSVSPADVSTDAELSSFIAAQVQADKNVSQVEASADNVAVTYKQNAKLFGFIPITVDATATVDAGGKVNVKYPWYAFLASTNKADLKAKIQSRVDAVLDGSMGADVAGNAGLTGNANANVGNTNVSGNAAADASANAEASANVVAKLTAEAQAKLIAEIKAVMESELAADANASANAAANAGGNVNVR
ncbi:MAG: hypothetical protein UY94_C0037G0004 [Parcubacteria group bacterium GW2011_GWA2_56_21]|nr:MAG: hypothetical protein UY94_C0037G0004 [Parcubacteria group bacterium GW2011_GWA2_56_21]